MNKLKLIFTACAFGSALLIANTASALSIFGSDLNSVYTGKGLYSGSCTVCHNTVTTQDPSWFSLYGRALLAAGADDDMVSITRIITAIQNRDYDNDGFSIKQEIEGGHLQMVHWLAPQLLQELHFMVAPFMLNLQQVRLYLRLHLAPQL